MADRFNADSSGAYGAMGYIAGIAASVNTAAYLDSVVYIHARHPRHIL
jgi:hypothetical protein